MECIDRQTLWRPFASTCASVPAPWGTIKYECETLLPAAQLAAEERCASPALPSPTPPAAARRPRRYHARRTRAARRLVRRGARARPRRSPGASSAASSLTGGIGRLAVDAGRGAARRKPERPAWQCEARTRPIGQAAPVSGPPSGSASARSARCPAREASSRPPAAA